MEKMRYPTIILFSCLFLFGLGGTAAAFTPDFMVNGKWASSFSNGETTIELGDNINLEYGWWNQLTDDVTWYIKYDGLDYWQELDDDYYPPDQRIYITGEHQIKCEVWRWQIFWWNYGVRYFTLKHEVTDAVEHATKYPIFLVPGVNGFSAINLLDTVLKTDWNLDEFDMAYFFGMARNFRNGHNQHVIDVSLSAWQNTEDRGTDLASQILLHLYSFDPCFTEDGGKLKVNIIAHSHGSTTSRIAINRLANFFADPDSGPLSDLDGVPSIGSSTGSRVASLTTVAGPHFGTPSKEGSAQFMEMLDQNVGPGTGQEVWDRAKVFFQSLGVWLACLSDEKRHIGEGAPGFDINNWEALLATQEFDEVAGDFAQKNMYKFNKKDYPCAGLPPGAKYVLTDDDITWLESQGVTVDPNDVVTEADLADPVLNPEGFDNIYNLAYGYGAEFTPAQIADGICGDGLGNCIPCNEDNAIRYYSFSGHAPYDTAFDVYDVGLLLFNSFHPIVGQEWEDLPVCYRQTRLWGLEGINDILRDTFYLDPSMDNLWDIFQAVHTLGEMAYMAGCMEGPSGPGADHPDMLDNADIKGPRDGIGYVNATDSFIPVDSANFGEYLDTYYWNHGDEHNFAIGIINPGARDPITEYREHVELLVDAGF
jgi:hypothetical protein